MKRYFTAIILSLSLFSAALAQNTYYSIFAYDNLIPEVGINASSATLAPALLPDLYQSGSIKSEVAWINEHDSLLVNFWETQGDTVLHLLCELSGIEWAESAFDIYLVRYFPTSGAANPAIIPIGGIRYGSLTTAMPTDSRQILNLIYQLAARMLDQAEYGNEGRYYRFVNHPLMKPGYHRRNNLAMLLALSTAQNVIGYDSAQTAFGSAFWKQNYRSMEIFKKHFQNSWFLSPERTLVDMVTAEPNNSRLVIATRAPRNFGKTYANKPRTFVEDLPLKGALGFALRQNPSNRLQVTKIDTYRLAYACGLREGDIIRRVNGALVRNQKAVIEKVLATFDQGGATLEIMRGGNMEQVILEPLDVFYYEEEQQFLEYDSLYFDSSFVPENESE